MIHCTKVSLEELDLSYNPLRELPPQVGDLQLLNELKEWEVGIGMLKHLQALNISHIELVEWPPQLERLKELETLDISHNLMEALPSEIKIMESLTYLDLSHNLLESVPKEIYNLPLQVSILIYLSIVQYPKLYFIKCTVCIFASIYNIHVYVLYIYIGFALYYDVVAFNHDQKCVSL